jgi:hypothetical protein
VSDWISVDDRLPDNNEPVVYCKRKHCKSGFYVGIAYWTVSQKWNPECESTKNPEGFSHWMPLPEPPKSKGGAE